MISPIQPSTFTDMTPQWPAGMYLITSIDGIKVRGIKDGLRRKLNADAMLNF